MSVEKTYYYTGVFTLKNIFDNEIDALQNKEPIGDYKIVIESLKFNKAKIKKENDGKEHQNSEEAKTKRRDKV
tara:strand:+ start:1963 stop:2181 length:219 start_codon:yes stop_codon:yes gene_type:complete